MKSLIKEFNIVYKTVNLINGKEYIGVHSTNKLNDGYLGSGKAMLRAIKKHSKVNFKIKIIKVFKCIKEAYDYESIIVNKEWVKSNNNYNLTTGGGYIFHTEEIRKKMSLTRIGKYCGENSPNYNKPKSKETKRKISEAHKGKKLSKEHKEKLSKIFSGKNHPLYGKKHSKETILKMSKAKLGKVTSEETKSKLSKTQSGGRNHKAKPSQHIETGLFFSCLKEGCEIMGENYYNEHYRVNKNSSLKKFIYI